MALRPDKGNIMRETKKEMYQRRERFGSCSLNELLEFRRKYDREIKDRIREGETIGRNGLRSEYAKERKKPS